MKAIETIRCLAKKHPNKKAIAPVVGCSYVQLIRFVNKKSGLTAAPFIRLCGALGIDIESFIERKGNPELPSDFDPFRAASIATGKMNDSQLLEIIYLILRKLPIEEFQSPVLLWEKCLNLPNKARGVRSLARDRELWCSYNPSQIEIITLTNNPNIGRMTKFDTCKELEKMRSNKRVRKYPVSEDIYQYNQKVAEEKEE